MNTRPHAHEKLFDDICSKLNELSRTHIQEDPVQNQEKIDRMQSQIRRFQSDLQGTQEELREKIKSLENVQISHQSDLHQQFKTVTEQLNTERANNTKLNSDLAKSLELGLQLQLEIQSLKSRTQQVQHEERKHAQTLQEKLHKLNHDLELTRALREETETELNKARNKFQDEQKKLEEQKIELESQLTLAKGEIQETIKTCEKLDYQLTQKNEEINFLMEEVEKLSSSFTQIEESSTKHHEAFRNLSEVAENKIVELKLALDRKTAECRDFEGHLQQATTQNQLLKQENANLKDYIAKINVYLQSASNSSPAAGPVPTPSAPIVSSSPAPAAL